MSGSPLINLVTLLESYRGRDKIMRTACFAACLGSGLAKSEDMSEKLMKVMSEISACRTILRLFDDLSMLTTTLRYGFGKHERDIIQRIFSLLSNAINQVFYPIEHIAWAAEKGLISVSAAPWWIASLLAWISSLTINILSCMWRLMKLHKRMAGIASKMSPSLYSESVEVKEIRHMQKKEYFNIIESASNLGLAIHWLPGARLWSGKLSNTTVGVLGVMSSVIGLLKMTVLK